MSRQRGKTVALFFGLPYTGKTALIHHLQCRLTGDAVFIDAIFRDIVSEKDVCLDRWLSEQRRFIGLVAEAIEDAPTRIVYVELGIFQRAYRTELIRRITGNGHLVIPVLLVCESRVELRARQEARQRKLEQASDKLKIAIGLKELYERIHPVFEYPEPGEAFFHVDTSESIDTCVDRVLELIG